MKKVIPLACVILGTSMATSAMAYNWPWAKDKKAQSMHQGAKTQDQQLAKSDSKNQTVEIKLYAHPSDDAKVIQSLPVSARLVPIFRKGEWVKVGSRHDGAVGWINVKQYHHAKRAYYQRFFHDNTETVYIHTEKDGKKGEKIVAYRNGKKLSDEQADALYKKMQMQQKQQWHEMQRFNRQMNRMMQGALMDAERPFAPMFGAPVMMMPGIVVIEHQGKNTDHAQPKAKLEQHKATAEQPKVNKEQPSVKTN